MQHRIEQIYRDHRQGLFILALSITRSRDLAEDAIQDAFTRLWRSQREPGGDPVAYVFASVRNAALMLRRRRRTLPQVPASIFDRHHPDPHGAAIDGERQRLMREAVEALPLSQRQAVVLRVYAGLTFRQIAEVLGEALPTVASRYRRALLRMKDGLGRVI